MHRANVLWVSKETPDLHGQGGQRRQYFQIRLLAEHGLSVHVASLAGEQSGASVARFATVRRVRQRRFDPRPQSPFLRLAQRGSYDRLVIAHAESYDLFRGQASGLELPTLVDFHNVNSRWYRKIDDDERRRYWDRVEQVITAEADVVTVCSRAEAAALPPGRATVMQAGNGVDLGEWVFDGPRERLPKLVAFGSWWYPSNRRGLRWFLDDVWPQVRSAVPEVALLVAGSGTPPVEPSDEPGITFLGRVPSLPRLFSDASAVIVPVLDAPGTPLKFAEALASGTATVATPEAAEGFPDAPAVITAEPAGFAAGCVQALRGRDEAAAWGEACRSFAEQHCTWTSTQAELVSWAAG